MNGSRPLRIGIVAGEESGDLLAADLVDELRKRTGRDIMLCGVGGRHLEAKGLKPLFDGSEIALMGISAVVRDLPRLLKRIGQVAHAIAEFEPDCVLTIDSPAFCLRVAGRIKARAPTVPIIHYVCPSVWGWAPWRAPRMKTQVDHVLCLLPFEPAELERLDGPPGTFVGHRLASHPAVLDIARSRESRKPDGSPPTLLVLPGSRRSEVARLLDPFGQTVKLLADRGNEFSIIVPTLPKLRESIEQAAVNWPVRPSIVIGDEAKWEAFAAADVALAASGTVTLELALAGVPLISCYRTDWMMRQARRLITTWAGALPNLIADRVIVPEYYDEYLRPARLVREIEQLWQDTPARRAQMDGFQQVRAALSTDRPAREIAGDVVLAQIEGRAGQGS